MNYCRSFCALLLIGRKRYFCKLLEFPFTVILYHFSTRASRAFAFFSLYIQLFFRVLSNKKEFSDVTSFGFKKNLNRRDEKREHTKNSFFCNVEHIGQHDNFQKQQFIYLFMSNVNGKPQISSYSTYISSVNAFGRHHLCRPTQR